MGAWDCWRQTTEITQGNNQNVPSTRRQAFIEGKTLEPRTSRAEVAAEYPVGWAALAHSCLWRHQDEALDPLTTSLICDELCWATGEFPLSTYTSRVKLKTETKQKTLTTRVLDRPLRSFGLLVTCVRTPLLPLQCVGDRLGKHEDWQEEQLVGSLLLWPAFP